MQLGGRVSIVVIVALLLCVSVTLCQESSPLAYEPTDANQAAYWRSVAELLQFELATQDQRAKLQQNVATKIDALSLDCAGIGNTAVDRAMLQRGVLRCAAASPVPEASRFGAAPGK